MMQQNPQAMQAQQRVKQITSMMEARKAILIAEMTMDYAKEEDKISSEVGGDPLLKLKSRELDLKARADQDRNSNNEARLDLDTMRAMMNDQQHDEKLEQDEDWLKCVQEFLLLNKKWQTKVKETILVEILRKINYNIIKEKHYD